MGFTQSIIIGSSAFLLGMVFVCQVVDIPLLYYPVTPEAIENGFTFYGIWWDAPGAVKALFHVALCLPLVALVAKLHRWTESAMFFDGSGIVLQMAVIILYLSVHIQSLRTFLPPTKTPSSFSLIPPAPPREIPATDAEKVEALRVLSAGNALVGLLLLGIIGMQIGQEYARRVEEREQRELDARLHAAAPAPAAESKKDI